MVSRWIWLALTACGLLVAGTATAEEPTVHTLTSTGSGGEVPAGVPTTLGWILTDGEGQPAFHQDATFEVTFENETLVATTPASGHDYDGIDPYRITFPEPGNYTVRSTVVDDSTGETVERQATFTGRVVEAPDEQLTLDVALPDAAQTGEPVEIQASVTGPEGEPIDHADVTVRARRALDTFGVLKTRLHDHDGQPTLEHAFQRAGTFEVSLTAAPVPAEDGPRLAPAATTETIQIEASIPGAPAVSSPLEEPLVNDREAGEEGDYQLFGTYDPYTSVGPNGRLRLGMLTLNETSGAPARNVSYDATLLGPDGQTRFSSSSLHAVDGFEYVTVSQPDPGRYHLVVDASKGAWNDQVELSFVVQPPAAATNAGPLFATPNASASLEAASPTRLPVHAEDAAGTPLTHGEVDVRLTGPDGVPAFAGKLHSHENGTLPLTLTAPGPGEHTLELLPQSLQPAPTPFTFGEEPGQPPTFAYDVQPAGSDEPLEQTDEPAPTNDAPGPGLLALAGLASLAAGASRGPR